jgi:hypothetical protein
LRRGRLFVAALTLCLGNPAHAQEDTSERFVIGGERLLFDTTIPIEGKERDIRYADLDHLRDLLRKHAEVKVLEINSGGGGHYPSMDIAALVIDFDLDTHVQNSCESSCVNVFLAGNKRTMARGARIGFHQLSWTARSVEEYYDKHRERRQWETPFRFAEWMYQDTQTETFNRLSYMVQRGVDAQFAIQTIRKPDTSMWYPYRAALLAAGVVTE